MINIDDQVHNSDKFVNELRRNKRNNLFYGMCADCKMNVENVFSRNNKILSIGDYKNGATKYRDLLKKIASDLQILKLNDRFHCISNGSTTSYFMLPLIFLIVFCIIL